MHHGNVYVRHIKAIAVPLSHNVLAKSAHAHGLISHLTIRFLAPISAATKLTSRLKSCLQYSQRATKPGCAYPVFFSVIHCTWVILLGQCGHETRNDSSKLVDRGKTKGSDVRISKGARRVSIGKAAVLEIGSIRAVIRIVGKARRASRDG